MASATNANASAVTAVNGTAVAEAADLARAAERAHAVDFESVQAGLVTRVLRQDERIEVMDLEHTLPAPWRPRGNATIYEPVDFISYVNRLRSDATTVWADPDRGEVTAVFDDHTNAETAGWRHHRATLNVRRDPEWAAWVERSGHLDTQEGFAEFLEDRLMSIVDPDPATMLEVALTFQAHRSASFERGTRLQSGDVQLRWIETTTASAGKGNIDVPEKFTIRVSPFLGVDPVDLVARLRYRISDGNLRIGFVLHRPDLAEQEAFDRIRALVAEGTPAGCLLGPAPASHGNRQLSSHR